MIEKTFTYPDYLGNERTEKHLFDLNAAELLEMETSVPGGLKAMIEKVSAAQDATKIMPIFKDMILKSYGVISPDGRQFMKSEEIRKSFEQCPAYSMLMMELLTVEGAASDFFNGIVPSKTIQEAAGNIKPLPGKAPVPMNVK